MRTRAKVFLGLAAAGLLGAALVVAHRGLTVAAGVKAKAMCSGVFVSGRAPEAIEREDMAAYASAFLDAVRVDVDRARRTVTGSVPLLARSDVVYRDGLGCTIAAGVAPDVLAAQAKGLDLSPRRAEPLPRGAVDGQRGEALDRIVASAFDEPDTERLRRTRAVVVVKDGRIVAERYAPGFGPDMPLPGWSMAKSVVGALAGVLVGEGKMQVEAPAPVDEWRDDPRKAITLDALLRMSSGLAFAEDYWTPFSDVNVMLFASPDAGALAAAKPLDAPPGTRWAYASGTTNIVARAMRAAFPTHADYLGFPRRALFDRIGMASAVLEPDASGTFVGSSFLFATARDWARLGILHAQDGVWNGERVLPEGWVRYSATPAPAAPAAQYGAQWWLRLDGASPEATLPPDAFHASGHGGQHVTVIPSRRVVVVRMGLSLKRGAWDQTAFAAAVLASLDGSGPP
ncbi:MAG: beta-lactamase family protein [Burkholderiales bacterium]|nr:beta-lactamase family protein [Burkholderiales bacterium]